MSPEFAGKINRQSLPQKALEAISNLLEDNDCLACLPSFREDLQAGKVNGQYKDLQAYLEQIYLSFEPIAIRLMRSRVKKFVHLRSQDYEDIYQEQRQRLWEVVATSFSWELYEDNARKAGAALVNYLQKCTGSFFADQIIARQRQVGMDIRQMGEWSQDNPERCLLRKEKRRELATRLTKWGMIISQTEARTLAMKIEGGLSPGQIAKSEGVSEGAIKQRLSKAKRKLIGVLKDDGELQGVVEELPILTKDSRWGANSREELLKKRRRFLLKEFDRWREWLPDKAAEALAIFYGLEGKKPVYDYQKTAEILGASLGSVRVSVPQALRIMMGKQPPSETTRKQKEDKGIYLSWKEKGAGDSVGLSPRQILVLKMYFGEGLSLKKIAEVLAISEETTRREKERALNAIRASQKENRGRRQRVLD